jgi:hypothetical protein
MSRVRTCHGSVTGHGGVVAVATVTPSACDTREMAPVGEDGPDAHSEMIAFSWSRWEGKVRGRVRQRVYLGSRDTPMHGGTAYWWALLMGHDATPHLRWPYIPRACRAP